MYRLFVAGHFVVRRTERFWGGLARDLAIEQVLMRSLKSTGGLTRGRGFEESQRQVWLLSMPSCSELNNAMQELTSQEYHTSDQHKDCSKSRMERDNKDLHTIFLFLKDRIPLTDSEDGMLRNIANGIVAEKHVNVEKAKQCGEEIIQNMIGKNVSEYSFKKSKQAVTLKPRKGLLLDGERIHIDPQTSFQRFLLAAKIKEEDVEEMFQYELCDSPPSMFDSAGFMRVANKSDLAETLWDLTKKMRCQLMRQGTFSKKVKM